MGRLGLIAVMMMGSAGVAHASARAEADCVVAARPAEVAALLATMPSSADDGAATARLLRRAGMCATAALGDETNGFAALATRGQLAEAMLRRRHAPLPPALPAGVAARPVASVIAIDEAGGIVGAVQAYGFAACLVRTDWAGTAAVLRSAPRTAAERSAIEALRPRFAGCTTPTAKFGMRADFLRAALAEETWHALVPLRATTAQR